MRLLVTGFGPFPRMPRNPSAALALAVAASPRWRSRGVAAECRVLATAYGALATELDPALATRPDAVLMIGVAGRADRVRIERRGTSRRSTLFPDAAGRVAAKPGASGPKDPPVRLTKVNAVAALRLLRAKAVPARLSRDAGRYLCNASYHRALALPCPVLFVHIPVPRPAWRRSGPRRASHATAAERLRDGLVAIGVAMLTEARRVAGR